MGEHAAVYGRPALVVAVDPRARVEVERAQRGLRIDLVDFRQTLEIGWPEARRRATRARQAWSRYAQDPSPERFAEVDSGSPESLTVVALGELSLALDVEPPSMAIRVESQLPIGSGFGSSASIAVALLGGVLALMDSLNQDLVDILALEVERRQHGLPSGVDHRTVLYGGVVKATRDAGGELRTERIRRWSPVLERLEVYQTGQPVETTGEVVAAVRRRRDQDPRSTEELLDRMGSLVDRFSRALTSDTYEQGQFAFLIRQSEGCLEDLGVVPPPVRETIRQVEAAGGAAKISGAGALTGTSAGCLLVHWPAGPPVDLPARLAGCRRQAVELGVEGFRVEEER